MQQINWLLWGLIHNWLSGCFNKSTSCMHCYNMHVSAMSCHAMSPDHLSTSYKCEDHCCNQKWGCCNWRKACMQCCKLHAGSDTDVRRQPSSLQGTHVLTALENWPKSNCRLLYLMQANQSSWSALAIWPNTTVMNISCLANFSPLAHSCDEQRASSHVHLKSGHSWLMSQSASI